MVLLMDYLPQRNIFLVMQKMEAVTFSRFRRASKRLYRIADEAENLSVMVDRRLLLYTKLSILPDGNLKRTLTGTIRNLRYEFKQRWNTERLINCNHSIQLKNPSPFIGFTFRQLEISSSVLDVRCDFSILKDCKWRNTTLITGIISDSLFEMVQPKELFLAFLSKYYISKPFPISIKKLFNYESVKKLETQLLKNVEHVVYYRPLSRVRRELIDKFFEYGYNSKGWKLKILEIHPSNFYKFPIALTMEGVINHIERMTLEEIDPQFQYLRWEMVDSSVEYFTKSVRSGSESGEKFNITLTKRAKYNSKWIQIVLTLKSIDIWVFNADFQVQCL